MKQMNKMRCWKKSPNHNCISLNSLLLHSWCKFAHHGSWCIIIETWCNNTNSLLLLKPIGSLVTKANQLLFFTRSITVVDSKQLIFTKKLKVFCEWCSHCHLNCQCRPEMIYPFNNRKSFYMTVSLGLADFDWLARTFRFADKMKLPSP